VALTRRPVNIPLSKDMTIEEPTHQLPQVC
jgi:hypothetical protein